MAGSAPQSVSDLDSRPRTRWREPKGPSLVVAGLVAVNAVYRWVIARPGYFWQDDYYITAWAKYNPLGFDYLFLPFSDHFQPLGFALAWVSQHVFPGSYTAAMLWTSVLYAGSLWVMYRLLVAIFGWRTQFYLVLIFWAFSIFTVQSYLWYSASLYLAPYLLLLPLSLLVAVKYLATPTWTGLILAFGTSTLVMTSHTYGAAAPLVTALLIVSLNLGGSTRNHWWQRLVAQWRLLIAQSLPIAMIAVYYLGRSLEGRPLTIDPISSGGFVLREFIWVIVPGLAGGPWRYNGYLSPEFPLFTPLGGFVVLEFLFLLGVLLWIKPRAFVFWIGSLVLIAGQLFAVTLGRGGGETALVIRYAAPGLVVLTLALAISVATSPFESPGWRLRGQEMANIWRSWGRNGQLLAVIVLGQAYVISFAISVNTPAFESPFAFNRSYMEKLIASSKEVPSDVVLIPQFVPNRVVGVNAPGPTSTQLVLSNLESLPAFSDTTDGPLWGFTDEGRLVEQRVWGSDAIGTDPGPCVARLEGAPVELRLNRKAEFWFATVSVGTLTETPARIQVELILDGATQGLAELQVQSGLQRTYAPLYGQGTHVRFTPMDSTTVCVTDATVGERFHWDEGWKQDPSSLPTQEFFLGR